MHLAGRLSDRLQDHLGAGSVFVDVAAIKPGGDFATVITEAVESCDVELVLIGKEWLGTVDDRGCRRLDDPDDLVRLEIATALRRGITVVPVLVDGAEAPKPANLPEELAALAGKQAIRLTYDKFDADVGILLAALPAAALGAHAPVDRSARGVTSVIAVKAGRASDGGFVGRDRELDTVLGLLAPSDDADESADDPPVATIVTGPPGVEKTALAEAAARVAVGRGWFTGGAVTAGLHGYRRDPDDEVSPAHLLRSLLLLLDMPADEIPVEVVEQATIYHRLLDERAAAGRRVLVMFDDVADAGQVRDLLPQDGSPHRALITSRTSLAELRGRPLVIDVLAKDDALVMLTAQLRRRRPRDRRVAADPARAAALVEHCGLLPLAVAIAAALLADEPDMPVVELETQLADAGARLRALDHEGWAVRSVFWLSYRRLPGPVARLFGLLGAVPGTETSLAVAAAAADGREADVRDGLYRLRRAHLIQRLPAQDGLPVRWRMHDLIRLYADEQLTDQDRADGFARVLGHYRRTTRLAWVRFSALPGTTVPGKKCTGFNTVDAALQWVAAERTGLVATVVQAATSHLADAAELAIELGPLLERARLHTDWLTAVSAVADAVDRRSEPKLAARVLTGLALALGAVRRHQEAMAIQEQIRDIHRRLGVSDHDGGMWTNYGHALAEAGRVDEAIDALQRALTIHRSNGEWHDAAWSWNNLGTVLNKARHRTRAIDAYARARELFRAFGDRHSEARTLINLGGVLSEVGRVDQAIDAHEQALRIFQELGDRHAEARARNHLGITLLSAGRSSTALAVSDRARALFRELDDLHAEGEAWNNLGIALHRSGQLDEAIRAFQSDVSICEELDDDHGRAQTLTNLGNVYADAGRAEEADQAWITALGIFERLGAEPEARVVRQRLATKATSRRPSPHCGARKTAGVCRERGCSRRNNPGSACVVYRR